jgi:hypothetical protein
VDAGLGDGVVGVQQLEEGDVHVLKYRVVQPLIARGDVELI